MQINLTLPVHYTTVRVNPGQIPENNEELDALPGKCRSVNNLQTAYCIILYETKRSDFAKWK